MRSIIQDGSDDWPPNEGEGASHHAGGNKSGKHNLARL